MHWAPIPIFEFPLPPLEPDRAVASERISRLLSRAPRRGFWLSAITAIVLLTVAVVCGARHNMFAGSLSFVLSILAGTGHIMLRHKINLALWITREPAAVYWAEPRPRHQSSQFLLALHTPAPVRLEALLTHDELIMVLQWVRHQNPDALIGSFSPSDSGGQLSGRDPWSPRVAPDGSTDKVLAQ
jgi:hypothetical protein